jgi:hypothetical protein
MLLAVEDIFLDGKEVLQWLGHLEITREISEMQTPNLVKNA